MKKIALLLLLCPLLASAQGIPVNLTNITYANFTLTSITPADKWWVPPAAKLDNWGTTQFEVPMLAFISQDFVVNYHAVHEPLDQWDKRYEFDCSLTFNTGPWPTGLNDFKYNCGTMNADAKMVDNVLQVRVYDVG